MSAALENGCALVACGDRALDRRAHTLLHDLPEDAGARRSDAGNLLQAVFLGERRDRVWMVEHRLRRTAIGEAAVLRGVHGREIA